MPQPRHVHKVAKLPIIAGSLDRVALDEFCMQPCDGIREGAQLRLQVGEDLSTTVDSDDDLHGALHHSAVRAATQLVCGLNPLSYRRPMLSRPLVIASSLFALIGAGCDAKQPVVDSVTATAEPTVDAEEPWTNLDAQLAPSLAKLPALAAVVFTPDGIEAAGAVGVRKHGDATPVTLRDKFHLGSCTKAMTATVAARLVERGRISWTTTVADVWPREALHAAMSSITLQELLSHTAGVPASLPADRPDVWSTMWAEQGDPRATRRKVAMALLGRAPAQPRGTFAYANAGYVVAGAMLEAAADKDWEALMRVELFEPLGMQGCGFGSQASPDRVDQPWPHELVDGEMSAGTDKAWDNPRPAGPSGTVHCPPLDWAKFGQLHLGDGGTFLTSSSMKVLHEVGSSGSYALGWMVQERDWAGGTAISHSGTNTLNFAIMWAAPAKRKGVLVMTNIGYDGVFEVMDAVVADLIRDHF